LAPEKSFGGSIPQTNVEFTGRTEGLQFSLCKTVPLRDVAPAMANGLRRSPSRTGRPKAGTGGMRAMTPPP
jgi:hypothetical protein